MSKEDNRKSKSHGFQVSPVGGDLEGAGGWVGAIAKVYSSVFGIGFIKGGGTVAALFCCLCVYGCWHYGIFSFIGFIVATVFVVISGIFSGNIVEPYWGKDSSKVVVDEVAGMCITLLFVKISLFSLLIGFILFRFYDILKPLGVRKMEVFAGGWGVMADDVLAGIYANITLQIVLLFTGTNVF